MAAARWVGTADPVSAVPVAGSSRVAVSVQIQCSVAAPGPVQLQIRSQLRVQCSSRFGRSSSRSRSRAGPGSVAAPGPAQLQVRRRSRFSRRAAPGPVQLQIQSLQVQCSSRLGRSSGSGAAPVRVLVPDVVRLQIRRGKPLPLKLCFQGSSSSSRLRFVSAPLQSGCSRVPLCSSAIPVSSELGATTQRGPRVVRDT